MVLIERTNKFALWLHSVRDERAKAKIALRIDRLALGNPGDVKSVGSGVSEMRIDYGPGYRVYFGRHGDKRVLLLLGGSKKTQQADIAEAKRLFLNWKSGQ